MKESFASELWRYIGRQFDELVEWVKPNPEDPLGLKILKGFFKGIVVLVLLALSPVIVLILIIAFIGAF